MREFRKTFRFAFDTWDAVLAGVSPLSRVGLYDRANSGLCDPAPPPRSGQDVVKDLHALLMAADVPGPYVLVGATMGGLFTRLYASTCPDDVVGMVLSNAIHEELYTLQALAVTPADNAKIARIDMEGGDVEGIWTTESLPITFEEVRRARLDSLLRAMPLVVLAAGSFPPDPLSPYPKGSDAVWPTLSILAQGDAASSATSLPWRPAHENEGQGRVTGECAGTGSRDPDRVSSRKSPVDAI